MLSAMNKEIGNKQALGAEIMDYAVYVTNGSRECIIYITDNLTRMQTLTWMLFSIIIQALLIGLIIAVILSFFMAQAITSPIEKITAGTLKISSGDYSHRLEATTNDEIGVLTRNFNAMAQVIENNLDAVSGEKEKLSKIIGCLGDGVAAFDKDGKLMFINSSARKLLSLPEDTDIDFESFAAKLDAPASMQFVKMSKTVHIAEHPIKTSI
jgi:two-component system sensor histidine kinase VicK